MKRSDRTAIALPKEIASVARELSSLASRHGWSALGVDRDDPPTMTAIFEAAIELLASQAKKKRSK